MDEFKNDLNTRELTLEELRNFPYPEHRAKDMAQPYIILEEEGRDLRKVWSAEWEWRNRDEALKACCSERTWLALNNVFQKKYNVRVIF